MLKDTEAREHAAQSQCSLLQGGFWAEQWWVTRPEAWTGGPWSQSPAEEPCGSGSSCRLLRGARAFPDCSRQVGLFALTVPSMLQLTLSLQSSASTS